MSVDYRGFLLAKPPPTALEKDDRKRELESLDVSENRKVKARSGGQCEIYELKAGGIAIRCLRQGWQIHHMIGGLGRRGRGQSALAEHKQHACAKCHADITRHILQHIGSQLPVWTDRYRRIT